jgi:hypothetical protein
MLNLLFKTSQAYSQNGLPDVPKLTQFGDALSFCPIPSSRSTP